MPAMTVNRKIAALGNCFSWVLAAQILERNPAAAIRSGKVTAPLPELFYNNSIRLKLAIFIRHGA